MIKIFKNNKGNTAIEYALLALFIGLAIISGLILTGVNTKQTFCTIASAIGAGSGNCGGSSSGSSSTTSGNSSSAFNPSNYNSIALKNGEQVFILAHINSSSNDLNADLSDLTIRDVAKGSNFTDANGNQIKTLGDLETYYSDFENQMHSKYDSTLGSEWVDSVFTTQTPAQSTSAENSALSDIYHNAPVYNMLVPKS